jgi:hypothetical protein
MNSRRVLALTMLACLVPLAGCEDPPPAPANTAPAAKPATATKAAQLSSQMVAAVSSGTGASAIGVHFALEAAPAVATPLPVQIAIVPHREFETVQVYFENHEGLAMPSGRTFGPVNNVKAEKALTHQLVLLPGSEGMFMVTVSVETMSDEGNVVRIFWIPVIVNPAKPATPAPTAPPEPAQN